MSQTPASDGPGGDPLSPKFGGRCGDRGPRIGQEGSCYCVRLAGHTGRHLADESWGDDVSWSNLSQPPAAREDGAALAFGEEYWRGHSVGRCEERERLEPSEDDSAALTELIRNGLLEDDGIGAQFQRTDDGLPRDLARWIIDAGWRKSSVGDTAAVLAELREEMLPLTTKPWIKGGACIALVEAAQQRLTGPGKEELDG